MPNIAYLPISQVGSKAWYSVWQVQHEADGYGYKFTPYEVCNSCAFVGKLGGGGSGGDGTNKTKVAIASSCLKAEQAPGDAMAFADTSPSVHLMSELASKSVARGAV
ncbi:hypothetical protein Trco_008475 [Trichoderma cornu-damae]|uniref:Uncharacterized protein n=1 Tax=Trichoderma cornu-damae TaxID=654480 RepID=A0A9P8QFF8_9HYPO|nr:hypothetical protein Trco_008475 [Trichoderma cornu-damae]